MLGISRLYDILSPNSMIINDHNPTEQLYKVFHFMFFIEAYAHD